MRGRYEDRYEEEIHNNLNPLNMRDMLNLVDTLRIVRDGMEGLLWFNFGQRREDVRVVLLRSHF